MSDTASKILVDSGGAAELLGICKRHFLSLEKSGRIGPMPIRNLGRCVRFSVESLRDWAAAGCKPRSEWLRRKDDG